MVRLMSHDSAPSFSVINLHYGAEVELNPFTAIIYSLCCVVHQAVTGDGGTALTGNQRAKRRIRLSACFSSPPLCL